MKARQILWAIFIIVIAILVPFALLVYNNANKVFIFYNKLYAKIVDMFNRLFKNRKENVYDE